MCASTRAPVGAGSFQPIRRTSFRYGEELIDFVHPPRSNIDERPNVRVSLFGVGTRLCFERDAWSMSKGLRRAMSYCPLLLTERGKCATHLNHSSGRCPDGHVALLPIYSDSPYSVASTCGLRYVWQNDGNTHIYTYIYLY